MNRHRLVWAGAILVTFALLALGNWRLMTHENAKQQQRGEAIFRGETSVAGRLIGHDLALPTLATRCVNCHEAPSTPQGKVPFALPLTSQRLQTAQSRRGGPPSTFDAGRLCTLLRSGTDPAQVIISTTMPRYDITDAQCDDLWVFLTTR
jgi:hypothetical protein